MNLEARLPESKISVLIVNYKTRRLTGLCLSLIKEKFDLEHLQVIVVDNDSRDESLDYLRNLNWIRLIERTVNTPEKAHIAHSAALDIGMQAINSRYVLLMHTDTLVKDARVIDLLLHQMTDARVACAGSVDQRHRKFLSRLWRSTKSVIRHRPSRRAESTRRKGEKRKDDYIKSFCSLWDVSVIRQQGLKFCAADRNPGYEMQDQLHRLGYKLKKVSTRKLFELVSHVQGGTPAEMGAHDKSHRRAISYRKLVSDYSNRDIDDRAHAGKKSGLG